MYDTILLWVLLRCFPFTSSQLLRVACFNVSWAGKNIFQVQTMLMLPFIWSLTDWALFCRENYIIWILSTWNLLRFTENEERKLFCVWIVALSAKLLKMLPLDWIFKKRFFPSVLCNFHLMNRTWKKKKL